MERELLTNKLLFNINQKHITVSEALDLAWSGGYDYHRYNQQRFNRRKIQYFNKEGKLIDTFDSIAEAGRRLKIGRGTVDDILYGKTKGRRNTGNYFRYADDEKPG